MRAIKPLYSNMLELQSTVHDEWNVGSGCHIWWHWSRVQFSLGLSSVACLCLMNAKHCFTLFLFLFTIVCLNKLAKIGPYGGVTLNLICYLFNIQIYLHSPASGNDVQSS